MSRTASRSRQSMPLAGVRILDLTQVWAGSKGTLFLAALGAQVIKVESPLRSDIVRGAAGAITFENLPNRDPGERRFDRSSTFNVLNRGKLGINLDLRTPEGMDLFKRLVAVSDVVTENFSATVMTRLGLDYDTLRAIKPDIIMLSMPGFGTAGPERDNVSWADTVEAMAGFVTRTGYPGDTPMYSVQAYPDPFSGVFGAAAVLTALRHRRITGRGQRIELSQHEAVLTMNAEAILEYQMTGRVLGTRGNSHPHMAPHGIYPVHGDDRWLAIAARNDAEWQALVAAMGSPDWARAEPLASLVGRLAAQAHIDQGLSAWTVTQDGDDLLARLQAAGVACGRVWSVGDVARNPHFQARGVFETVEHPQAGTHQYPTSLAFRFTDAPIPPNGPAPLFGQHNRVVLCDILGLSDAQVDDLEARGIIADAPAWSRTESEKEMVRRARGGGAHHVAHPTSLEGAS